MNNARDRLTDLLLEADGIVDALLLISWQDDIRDPDLINDATHAQAHHLRRVLDDLGQVAVDLNLEGKSHE